MEKFAVETLLWGHVSKQNILHINYVWNWRVFRSGRNLFQMFGKHEWFASSGVICVEHVLSVFLLLQFKESISIS